MKSKTDYTEINGEIYLSFTGVLKMILGGYLFPHIEEVKAYNVCKRKLEYICLLLATRKYCKNTKEAMKEIQGIRTAEQMQEYINKITNYITSDDMQSILEY